MLRTVFAELFPKLRDAIDQVPEILLNRMLLLVTDVTEVSQLHDIVVRLHKVYAAKITMARQISPALDANPEIIRCASSLIAALPSPVGLERSHNVMPRPDFSPSTAKFVPGEGSLRAVTDGNAVSVVLDFGETVPLMANHPAA
jgi:hypothetical protein